MTSHDRHPPGRRRTGQDQQAKPETPASPGTGDGTGPGEAGRPERARGEGDQAEWGRSGRPDQAEQRDDDEYEPL